MPVSSRKSGYSTCSICFTCGLCFAQGTHRYAIHECLPEGWDFCGATFVVCSACGTSHAIEHTAQKGQPDRLRARREALFLPVSPRMRQRYDQLIYALRSRNKADRYDRPLRKEPRINLLPAPHWKAKISLIFDLALKPVEWMFTLILLIGMPIASCLGSISYKRSVRWRKKHFPEYDQKEAPIWVTSSKAYKQRILQIHANHDHYEALWPVTIEALPALETIEVEEHDHSVRGYKPPRPKIYKNLTCAHCSTTGSLMDVLPKASVPESPVYSLPECPSCKQQTVLSDAYYQDTDASFYLMGDIFRDERQYTHEWLQQFHSRDVDRLETAIYRLFNGELNPHPITNPEPENAPRFWVPPGHTYEVHLKKLEKHLLSVDDTSIARWANYEVVGVFEGEKVIYERPTVER